VTSHPYAHLDMQNGYIAEQLAQEAADAEFRDLRDTAERSTNSRPNPYAHLNERQTLLAEQFEQQAGADGSDLRDLINAADLPTRDKAALAQAWGGAEATAEYRTDDTDDEF